MIENKILDNFNPQDSLVISSLMYRIFHREDSLIVCGDGSAVRDFVYSKDVAEGIIYDPSTNLKDSLKKTWEWFIGHPDEYSQKMNYFKSEVP